VRFDCQFRSHSFNYVGSFYTCFSTITGTGSTLLEIKGTHEAGKSDSDIEGLIFENQPLNDMPKGIENYFLNLKAIYIINSNLASISPSDLPFPKLVYFFPQSNKISSVDGNLFVNNPKLIRIGFNNNEIQHVGRDLLTGLKDLKYVDFRVNPCINKEANTPEEIQELNRQLPISCPPLVTDPPTTSTTISTTTEFNVCSSGCADQIETVRDEMKENIQVQKMK
jgi:hypothetical protein